jgi:hypothetical protein
MKAHLTKIAEVAADWRADALMVAGAAGVSYGAWLAWPPAGWIIGGLLLIAAGVVAAKAA